MNPATPGLLLLALLATSCADTPKTAEQRAPAPSAAPLELRVHCSPWQFEFQHVDAAQAWLDGSELHLPAHAKAVLRFERRDSSRPFGVRVSCPELQLDRVLGASTLEVEIETGAPGEHLLCNLDTSAPENAAMRAKVVVHTPEAYAAWCEARRNAALGPDLVTRGQIAYERSGCTQCHSRDGSKLIGPSHQGLRARIEAGTEKMASGESYADLIGAGKTYADVDIYLYQSILEPARHVREGYHPMMPLVPLKAYQVEGLVAYLKTL
ncbi:MAG: hypothetical protein JNM84_13210 [Planctomycetes bacterium]|nr:hypothetical protein [Planctomycetota bacterium]